MFSSPGTVAPANNGPSLVKGGGAERCSYEIWLWILVRNTGGGYPAIFEENSDRNSSYGLIGVSLDTGTRFRGAR